MPAALTGGGALTTAPECAFLGEERLHREFAMRAGLVVAVLFGALALPVGAGAQPNPNSQQIIDALRPGGNLLGGPTRGIRPVSPGTPSDASSQPQPAAAAAPPPAMGTAPSPAAARPPAPATAPPVAPSVSLTVSFASGSAELTPQAVRTLDELGKALASSDLSAFRFRVEGHTDTVGPRDMNQSLSERRAAAVVSYLISRFAIDSTRLQAVGLGESRPAVQTGDEVNEPRNRRVQVVNIGS
jgi:outer membrane protein OmpA-like peptidoglycan-associated protein